MSDTMPSYYDAVMALLKLFKPSYFDPESPDYVDPVILDQLFLISVESRPWCLSEAMANMAQAMYLAYLIDLRNDVASGQTPVTVAGPIVSEKEGDISVTYADLTKTGASGSNSGRPPSDPWDQWNRLYKRCGRGAVLTRYGDPCRQQSLTQTLGSIELSLMLSNSAIGVWRLVY